MRAAKPWILNLDQKRSPEQRHIERNTTIDRLSEELSKLSFIVDEMGLVSDLVSLEEDVVDAVQAFRAVLKQCEDDPEMKTDLRRCLARFLNANDAFTPENVGVFEAALQVLASRQDPTGDLRADFNHQLTRRFAK